MGTGHIKEIWGNLKVARVSFSTLSWPVFYECKWHLFFTELLQNVGLERLILVDGADDDHLQSFLIGGVPVSVVVGLGQRVLRLML